MANSKFKLDKVSGTGTGSIKIAPVESTSQNSYTETYRVKVEDKVISNVELKLLKVPKDKYVPTSDDGLVSLAPTIGSDEDSDILSLENLLEFFKKRSISNTVPYNKTIHVLHPIPSDDPDYLNKVGNLIYLWEYRTNQWVSLSSVRKKLNIGASEDFVLNTAYYGGIMLYFKAKEYTLPDTLLKDDATKGHVYVFGTNYIFWPNKYTQGGNSTNKPYHVKIKLKDSTPIGGYRGGYNDCTYTQLKRNLQDQYERNDTPRVSYSKDGNPKNIDILYTYYSSSHITISLQEDQPSPFNFIILKDNVYLPDKVKIGTQTIGIEVGKMISDQGNFTGAIVLKGLDEYTIPKVPSELGFKDIFYGRRPNIDWGDEDEDGKIWED